MWPISTQAVWRVVHKGKPLHNEVLTLPAWPGSRAWSTLILLVKRRRREPTRSPACRWPGSPIYLWTNTVCVLRKVRLTHLPIIKDWGILRSMFAEQNQCRDSIRSIIAFNIVISELYLIGTLLKPCSPWLKTLNLAESSSIMHQALTRAILCDYSYYEIFSSESQSCTPIHSCSLIKSFKPHP